MKVTRRGARADHGQSSIELSSPTFAWVKTDATVTIRQGNVKDFSTSAHHSYSIRINATELGEIFQVLANAAADDPAAIGKVLEPCLRSLIRLQYAAAGLKL